MGGPILTRIALDPALPAVRRALWDIHTVHRTLAAITDGWPPQPRLLWARPTPGMLLVQAPYPLPTGRIPGVLGAEHVDLAPTLASLSAGDRVTIRTVVNPTWQASATRQRRRYAEHERPAWLASLLSPALSCTRITGRFLGFRTGHKPGVKAPITIAWWSAVVTAVVTDPAELARMVTCGVGHARAFGCGLLDLTPTRVPAAATR